MPARFHKLKNVELFKLLTLTFLNNVTSDFVALNSHLIKWYNTPMSSTNEDINLNESFPFANDGLKFRTERRPNLTCSISISCISVTVVDPPCWKGYLKLSVKRYVKIALAIQCCTPTNSCQDHLSIHWIWDSEVGLTREIHRCRFFKVCRVPVLSLRRSSSIYRWVDILLYLDNSSFVKQISVTQQLKLSETYETLLIKKNVKFKISVPNNFFHQSIKSSSGQLNSSVDRVSENTLSKKMIYKRTKRKAGVNEADDLAMLMQGENPGDKKKISEMIASNFAFGDLKESLVDPAETKSMTKLDQKLIQMIGDLKSEKTKEENDEGDTDVKKTKQSGESVLAKNLERKITQKVKELAVSKVKLAAVNAAATLGVLGTAADQAEYNKDALQERVDEIKQALAKLRSQLKRVKLVEERASRKDQKGKLHGLIVIEPMWSEWSSWSKCSDNCDDRGFSIRRRDCDTLPDVPCNGINFDVKTCHSGEKCKAQWADWGNWGPCSVSCGVGLRARSRVCTTGTTDQKCTGHTSRLEKCRLPKCEVPVAKPLPSPVEKYVLNSNSGAVEHAVGVGTAAAVATGAVHSAPSAGAAAHSGSVDMHDIHDGAAVVEFAGDSGPAILTGSEAEGVGELPHAVAVVERKGKEGPHVITAHSTEKEEEEKEEEEESQLTVETILFIVLLLLCLLLFIVAFCIWFIKRSHTSKLKQKLANAQPFYKPGDDDCHGNRLTSGLVKPAYKWQSENPCAFINHPNTGQGGRRQNELLMTSYNPLDERRNGETDGMITLELSQDSPPMIFVDTLPTSAEKPEEEMLAPEAALNEEMLAPEAALNEEMLAPDAALNEEMLVPDAALNEEEEVKNEPQGIDPPKKASDTAKKTSESTRKKVNKPKRVGKEKGLTPEKRTKLKKRKKKPENKNASNNKSYKRGWSESETSENVDDKSLWTEASHSWLNRASDAIEKNTADACFVASKQRQSAEETNLSMSRNPGYELSKSNETSNTSSSDTVVITDHEDHDIGHTLSVEHNLCPVVQAGSLQYLELSMSHGAKISGSSPPHDIAELRPEENKTCLSLTEGPKDHKESHISILGHSAMDSIHRSVADKQLGFVTNAHSQFETSIQCSGKKLEDENLALLSSHNRSRCGVKGQNRGGILKDLPDNSYHNYQALKREVNDKSKERKNKSSIFCKQQQEARKKSSLPFQLYKGGGGEGEQDKLSYHLASHSGPVNPSVVTGRFELQVERIKAVRQKSTESDTHLSETEIVSKSSRHFISQVETLKSQETKLVNQGPAGVDKNQMMQKSCSYSSSVLSSSRSTTSSQCSPKGKGIHHRMENQKTVSVSDVNVNKSDKEIDELMIEESLLFMRNEMPLPNPAGSNLKEKTSNADKIPEHKGGKFSLNVISAKDLSTNDSYQSHDRSGKVQSSTRNWKNQVHLSNRFKQLDNIWSCQPEVSKDLCLNINENLPEFSQERTWENLRYTADRKALQSGKEVNDEVDESLLYEEKKQTVLKLLQSESLYQSPSLASQVVLYSHPGYLLLPEQVSVKAYATQALACADSDVKSVLIGDMNKNLQELPPSECTYLFHKPLERA